MDDCAIRESRVCNFVEFCAGGAAIYSVVLMLKRPSA